MKSSCVRSFQLLRGKPTLNLFYAPELRSCVKVEVADLGSPSLKSLWYLRTKTNIEFGLCARAQELCIKVEVADLGPPSLPILTVSLDAK